MLIGFFFAAFIKWDINPANWSADDRSTYIYFTSLIAACFIWVIIGVLELFNIGK